MTSNHDQPLRCVGGPYRGEYRHCPTWGYDFLERDEVGRIVIVRYVRAARVNKRADKITYFLRYFGTRRGHRKRFDEASRKAAV